MAIKLHWLRRTKPRNVIFKAVNGTNDPGVAFPLMASASVGGIAYPLFYHFRGVAIHRLDDLAVPSNLWMYVDSVEGRNELAIWSIDSFALNNALFTGHPGGSSNYLFVDGHAKTIKGGASAAPVNMWGVNMQRLGPANSLLVNMLNEASQYGASNY